ncbi:MAG: glutathione S-transferase family protein [Pseudohongiellaceae bacterium]|nr:glutathione S-transferase family protein [Pseudohongiellaceae bacterium]
MKVYGDIYSGNCYKIKLLLQFLQLPHEWEHVDILAGATHTPDFKAMNANERIPVLELSSGRYLCESNAILNYLADDSPFLPSAKYERAQVLQWQFFEQYSHEPYIATARYIKRYLGLPAEREAEFHAKQAGGHKALKVMNEHLGTRGFFVANMPSIADISLYAYTHVAHEGGFDLSEYKNILAWFKRIEALPHYITMSIENA